MTNQILATFPFLCRLSLESRQLVEAGAKIITADQGACILRKGDRIRGLYLVLSGKLRVYTLTSEGDEVTLYTIDSGESCPLAMNAILADKDKVHRTWIDVETKTVRIFFIPLTVFKDLYENESVVREFALGVLSGRISTLMTALEDLSLNPVGQRVKGYLLRSAGDKAEVETTHQQIALAVGTAREVVSRKIRDLRRAGLIRTGRGRIRILQRDAWTDD